MGQWYSGSFENCFPQGFPGSIPGVGAYSLCYLKVVTKQKDLKRR